MLCYQVREYLKKIFPTSVRFWGKKRGGFDQYLIVYLPRESPNCRWQFTPRYVYTLEQQQQIKKKNKTRNGLGMLSRHSVGTYQGNEPTRNSSGNTRPQSSQLAEPLWTDPGLKKGGWRWNWCARADIYFFLKCRWGLNGGTFPQSPRKRSRSYH